MKIDDINDIRLKVKKKSPLIHCITNPISINQCANAVLAVGARPIMAEHPREVCEITKSAHSLLLNLGNITDVRMESMMISAKTANEKNIPIVLDLVGIACSKLRKEFAKEIISKFSLSIIKGNYSEINALYNDSYTGSGVDADTSLSEDALSKVSVNLSKKTGSVIVASGKTDIITDSKSLIYAYNGCVQLASVTGTGCMLGTLASCYLSVCSDIRSAITACSVLGISGFLAQSDKGNGSFMVNLMDALSVLKDSDIEKYLKMEEKEIEKF